MAKKPLPPRLKKLARAIDRGETLGGRKLTNKERRVIGKLSGATTFLSVGGKKLKVRPKRKTKKR